MGVAIDKKGIMGCMLAQVYRRNNQKGVKLTYCAVGKHVDRSQLASQNRVLEFELREVIRYWGFVPIHLALCHQFPYRCCGKRHC